MALAEEARAVDKLPNGAVKDHELYKRWVVMRRRCYDDRFVAYPFYGAKGTRVCEEWRRNYLPFQKWALSRGWEPGLTLDRIDSRDDYCPRNCRWVTLAEQQRNRPEWCIPVTIGGVTKLAGEWADENGILRSLVFARIRKLGWDPVKAVTTPSSHNGRTELRIGRKSLTVYAWAKKLGVSRSALYQKRKNGADLGTEIRRMMKETNVQDS